VADQVYTNTAEGGTDGTAVVGDTAGNTGGASGDYLKTAVGTWTFEADAAKGGSLGYQLVLGGSAGYLRGDDPAPSGRGGMGGWFYWNGTNPGGTLWLGSIRDVADASLASCGIFTNGTFRAGAGTTLQATSAITLPSAGLYRFQLFETPGASTTTCTVEAKVWDLSGTQVGSTYNSGPTLTAGSTNPPARFRFGAATAVTGHTVLLLDNLRWGHVATGDLGDVANAAPTATITGNQHLPAGVPVTATVTPSDVDGTIAATNWSIVAAKSTASIGTLTHTADPTVNGSASPALGNLVTLQCDVIDNGGVHASPIPTTEIRTPIPGSTTAVPLALDGTHVVGTMTRVGSATTDGAALADATNTTYIESGAVSASEQSERYRWQPSDARATSSKILTLGTDTGTCNAIVRVYEGDTLRQAFSPVLINATPTDYTFTLSTGTIAAVTAGGQEAWGNLRFEVGFTS
jgi:hypothetical protein